MKFQKTVLITLCVSIISLSNVFAADSSAQKGQTIADKLNTVSEKIQATTPPKAEALSKVQKKAVAAEKLEKDVKSVAKTASKAVDPNGTARVEVERTVVNLGEVGPGKIFNLHYDFKNAGDGLLKISKVHASCGCTVPKLAKKEYLPGEKGRIKVTFRAPKSAGVVTKHLYIYSNDPVNPKYELKITCKVELKVLVKPKRLDLMLDKENAGAGPIVLESLDGKKFSVTSITNPKGVAEFEYSKEPAKKVVLTPKFNLERLADNLTGAFLINLSHPDCSTVILRYNTPSPYIISPRAIILTKIKKGQKVKRSLWITSNYSDKIDVESIKSKKGTVKILKQQAYGNRYEVEVELQGPKDKKSSKRFHSDELIIKIKDGPKLKVRCQQWFN